MKVYGMQYSTELMSSNNTRSLTPNTSSEVSKVYTSASEFVSDVYHTYNDYRFSNVKVFVGELKEIPVDKVLNPFG